MKSPAIFPFGLKKIPVSAWLFFGVFGIRLFSLAKLTESQFLVPHSGDMQFYNDWALRILGGHWVDHTAFYGLPLYAYLLATIYAVCGHNPFVPGLLQACLDAGTAVLIYRIGALIFAPAIEKTTLRVPPSGEFIGLLAAIGWACFQPAQAYSIIIMPTAWLVFVFWFVVWQIVRRRHMPPLWALLLLGGLMGFTAMGIATILFLVPMLLAALFLLWRASIGRRVTGAAMIMAGVFIGASPAWIHNYFIARDPVFLSAHSGVNFWIGNNPVATGYPKFPPGLHAGQEAMLKDSITSAEKAAGKPLRRSEVSTYWSDKARAWIRAHPGDFLKLLGAKVKNFWSAFTYDDISVITALRDQSVILPGFGFGLIAALGLPGLLLAWWKAPRSRWVGAAVLLHMASLLTVFVTERYRLAAVPGLLLFAAFGLYELWDSLVKKHHQLAAFFFLLLFCSTAFVSVPQRDPTLWALDTYNSGLQAMETKNFSLAKRKLDLAYAYSPENAEINFAEGNLHLETADLGAAKRFYFAALRLDPTHAGAYNNSGVLALKEERWKLAGNFFRHAIEYAPNDPKIHYLFARAELKSGDPCSARKEIARAIQLDASHPEFVALQKEIEVRQP
jgi:tetratricopeptide (TPR) repeat protein